MAPIVAPNTAAVATGHPPGKTAMLIGKAIGVCRWVFWLHCWRKGRGDRCENTAKCPRQRCHKLTKQVLRTKLLIREENISKIFETLSKTRSLCLRFHKLPVVKVKPFCSSKFKLLLSICLVRSAVSHHQMTVASHPGTRKHTTSIASHSRPLPLRESNTRHPIIRVEFR